MKHLLLTLVFIGVTGCSGSNEPVENDATELRDWAQSQTSRAEITTELATAKMSLRLLQQTDPQSAEAVELASKVATLEKELKDIESRAKK